MRHGSHLDPPNRFVSTHTVVDLEQLEWDDEHHNLDPRREIVYLPDDSKSVVSENDSPDIPFRYSVNPYRGCVHGCSYCYARNSHEYLGLNAGLDFETRILVKHDAARLFRSFLANDKWRPEPIVFCGVTDCYQPAEREFRLTRACLEVALECRQPVNIITKNALVVRDLDVIRELAARNLVHVSLSITTLDVELARAMEPRTSIPAARLRAIEQLAAAGVPTRVMASPMIPGLNDHELPAILKAARAAGATDSRYILVRLPQTVAPIFLEWLQRTQPLKAAKVEQLIRQSHDGQLNHSQFGQRMRGTGQVADQIASLYQVFRKKLGFDDLAPLSTDQFRPPGGQLRLFT